LDHCLEISYPDQYSSSIDRFLHLIRAQRASEYPHTNHGGSSSYYRGSSPYYTDMYDRGYAPMQTVVSSALERGNVLQQDLSSDDTILDSVNHLVTAAKSSYL
jgi:hypothetical protein